MLARANEPEVEAFVCDHGWVRDFCLARPLVPCNQGLTCFAEDFPLRPSTLHPPVQLAILDGLGQVGRRDGRRVGQVCNGAGHFQDARVGAGA